MKAPKGCQRGARSMQIKVVGDFIVGLLQFAPASSYQLCVWKKKSGDRVQVETVTTTDAQGRRRGGRQCDQVGAYY